MSRRNRLWDSLVGPPNPVPENRGVRRHPLVAARLVAWCCLSGLFALAGCSASSVDVSGKATVDGKPLNNKLITILFAPDLDNPIKKIPAGVLDEQGNFTMSTGATGGVPPGRYKVHVFWDSKNAKGQPCPVHSRFLDSGQTPLTVEVVANPSPGAYDLKFTRN